MLSTFTIISYILASVFFIIAIRSLSSPKTAAKGNMLGAFGMTLAVIATLVLPEIKNYLEIFAAIIIGGIIGVVSSQKIKMTALPQMVSLFNGSGGLAAF
jgi:NAD(P) transhydrogenase subunit beta